MRSKRLLRRLRRYVRRLSRHRHVLGRAPTSAEQQFASANRAFWDAVLGRGGQDPPADGYVLMEVHQIAYFVHYIGSVARIVAHVRGLTPLPLTLPDKNLYPADVLASYGARQHFSVGRVWYILYTLKARWQARRAFQRLQTPEDVLQLRVDGLEVGDLLYDEILRQKDYATLARVDGRVLQMLRRFYMYRSLAFYLLRAYPIRYAVFSHVIGLEAGVFVRYLVQHQVPVLYCRSAAQPSLKKYYTPADVRHHPLEPEARYIEYALHEIREQVLPLAEEHLKERFQAQTQDRDAVLAFQSGKKFHDRETFAAAFHLDAAKRNVFVMLHAFNDYPHFQGIHSILFRDFGEWFRATLQIARSHDEVNWIFKEHPVSRFYHTRDLDLASIFADIDGAHLLFLDWKADFNAQSLPYLADTIITCRGTAGVEYAALGIPCILGGESPYSGVGFTHEPRTQAEYEKLLREVEHLDPLSQEQRDRAKISGYFQLRVLRNPPLFFLPFPVHYIRKELFGTLRVDQAEELDSFWSDVTRWLAQINKTQAEEELEKLATFIRQDAWTQYIDLEKYPFLEPAVYH